jgi:hypothetical protein
MSRYLATFCMSYILLFFRSSFLKVEPPKIGQIGPLWEFSEEFRLNQLFLPNIFFFLIYYLVVFWLNSRDFIEISLVTKTLVLYEKYMRKRHYCQKLLEMQQVWSRSTRRNLFVFFWGWWLDSPYGQIQRTSNTANFDKFFVSNP